MQKITPFLWFDHQAEEAAEYYVSVFSARGAKHGNAEPSKILDVARYGEAGPGEAGTVMTVSFMLEGQEFVALNGGPLFSFNESVSFAVSCEAQDEVDELWEELTSGGGQPSMCGWLKDRYGLSWQIVPSALNRLLSEGDADQRERVMTAMLQMQKIDIAALEQAYAGA